MTENPSSTPDPVHPDPAPAAPSPTVALGPQAPEWSRAGATAVALAPPPVVRPPAPPYPNQLPPQTIPPRSERIPFPRGALLAILATGVAAAVFVPVDRPGIGWLLAGLVAVAAVCAVDRVARLGTTAAKAQGAVAAVDATDPGAAGSAPGPESTGAVDRAKAVGAQTDTVASAGASAVPGPEAIESVVVGAAGAPSEPESPSAAAASTAPEAETGAGESDSSRALVWERVWWAVLTLALLSVGWFRAAPWLFAACAVGAAVAGSLAVVGRRSVYGMVFDVMAVPCAALMAVPWVYRGVERARARRSPSGAHRVWWSAAATLALLLVIVPLLAGADAVFARLVSGLVPRMDGASVWQWVFLFLMGGLGTAGALYLLAGPLRAAMEGDSGVARVISRRFTRPEWGLPVGALIVVFAAFVGTQLAVLFGGDEYVQRTAELTYAEYARGGFWQLSIVSLLTLGVIWIVWQGAAKESAPDRLWLRIALAAVTGLSLVIVVSAVGRMWLYQQAYGFTVLRLVVAVFELWIGFVYLLVAASLARLDRRWPARAALGAGLATLFVLAVLNPERLVAERNIDRWQSGKSLDTAYLSRLSADALPAVDTLPDPQRAQIAGPIRARLEPDPWQGWNLSRSSARR